MIGIVNVTLFLVVVQKFYQCFITAQIENDSEQGTEHIIYISEIGGKTQCFYWMINCWHNKIRFYLKDIFLNVPHFAKSLQNMINHVIKTSSPMKQPFIKKVLGLNECLAVIFHLALSNINQISWKKDHDFCEQIYAEICKFSSKVNDRPWGFQNIAFWHSATEAPHTVAWVGFGFVIQLIIHIPLGLLSTIGPRGICW